MRGYSINKSSLKLPLLQNIHRLVVGQVQFQRGDGDVARAESAEVGAGFVYARGGFAADPVVGPPARIDARHQLPIWVARLAAEDRRLWHDPRARQCSLASLTSLTYDADTLVAITYTEPSRDLLGKASKIAGA